MLSNSLDVEMNIVIDFIQFVRRSNGSRYGCYLICPTYWWTSWWMKSDSSDVVMTVVIVWPSWLVAPEDPSEGCDILGYFLQQSDIPIGPSLLFGLQGFSAIFFRRTFAIEHSIITLDRLFDDEQNLSRWSNVTVHHALVICIIKYIRWYWGYFWCNCDILDKIS